MFGLLKYCMVLSVQLQVEQTGHSYDLRKLIFCWYRGYGPRREPINDASFPSFLLRKNVDINVVSLFIALISRGLRFVKASSLYYIRKSGHNIRVNISEIETLLQSLATMFRAYKLRVWTSDAQCGNFFR
jgi:hypothetical protein